MIDSLVHLILLSFSMFCLVVDHYIELHFTSSHCFDAILQKMRNWNVVSALMLCFLIFYKSLWSYFLIQKFIIFGSHLPLVCIVSIHIHKKKVPVAWTCSGPLRWRFWNRDFMHWIFSSNHGFAYRFHILHSSILILCNSLDPIPCWCELSEKLVAL